MTARETILGRLRQIASEEQGPSRASLTAPLDSRTGAAHVGHGAAQHPPGAVGPSTGTTDPSLWAADDPDALARRFAAGLQSLDGVCEIVGSPVAAGERVAELVEGVGSHVLSWALDQLPLPGLEETLRRRGVTPLVPEDLHDPACRHRAANAEVGITGVEAAFAGTGSLLLAAGPGRSRVTSLLPSRHVALVPSNRIFGWFEDWLKETRRDGHLADFLRESAQLVFITGPSRSADIELNLTLGVHGPRTVHAIVFPPR